LPSLIPLSASGTAPPLYCIHGLGGHVAVFLPLARALGDDRPVYGLQAQGLESGQQPQETIEAMAAQYVCEIRQCQPQGPYLLAGWSMGGLLALEAARQLTAAGEAPALVAMFDTYLSLGDLPQHEPDEQSPLAQIASQLNVAVAELKDLPLARQWERIAELAENQSGEGIAEIRRLAAVCRAQLAAVASFQLQPYDGPAVLFASERGHSEADRHWPEFCRKLRVEKVSGDHFSMLREPHVRALAERLGSLLQQPAAGDEKLAQP
jgi:thioesterase domain-containing protein